MKVVLVRFRDGERRDFPLVNQTMVLGRRPDCDLRIPTRDVSRRHCQISVRDDEVSVKDLGSSNGTFVNGERITEAALSPGDSLMIGPVVFIVQIDGQPTEIKPSDAVPPRGVAARAPAQPEAKPDAEGDAETEVFELSADDFDLEDAISALDELDDDEDLP